MKYLNDGFGFLKPYKKMRWIKKRSWLIVCIMLVFSLRLFASSYGQSISIHVKEVPLIEVMKTIQNQTGHSYFLNGKDLANLKVSAALNNADLKTTMGALLKGKPATWSMKGKTIIIRKINSNSKETRSESSETSVEAKQQTVSGKVTDSQGNALIGVTVKVVNSNIATSTNENGEYELTIPTEATSLSFSLLGFQVEEVLLEGRSVVNVSLKEGSNDLEEVVVVGYGTQLKRDLTGAVSKIDGEDLKNMPIRNATEGLQGQTSGVQVTSTGGSPGTPPAVRIRGIGTVNDNNPLYVVDGLPQSDIGWLNPNDIISMEVLKDASATAIYGSRAANGVIMVTTAKGAQRGNELSNLISFDSYLGFQNPIKTYEMMNAKEFMEYKNLANTNAGLDPYFTDQDKADVLKFLKSNTGSEEGTNWWKEINNKDALVQNYDIAISGGIKDLAYRSSFSYMDQEGIISGSDYDRMSWRTNFNHNLREWLSISGNFGLINEGRGNVLEGSPGFNTAFISFVADPISQVYRTGLKDIPAFLKDGLFLDRIDPNNPWSSYGPILMTNKENPVAQTEIYKNNRWKGIAIKGGGAVDIKIMPWLKFRSSLGIDLQRGVSNYFLPKYYLNGNQFNNDATVGASNSLTNYYVWENTLTYEKEIEDHKMSLMVGTSAEQWKGESSGASRQGLVSNDPSQWIINAGSINPQASGTKWENALNSYFGRAFYSYKNRYMVTANLRYDGSSNFGEGRKWGTFPSVSAGWNFSEEEFMDDVSWLDAGKLRLSWGMIGNQNIGGGAYLTTYSGNMGYYLFGPRNPQLIGGSNYIGNPLIQWEQTEQLDIGLELAFLQNKLHFNFDYYKKTTDGMLLNVPLPAYLGFPNSPWSNAGGVQNSGLEFDISYKDKVGEFGYSIAANASTVKNKVLSLGGGEPITGGGWISYSTTMTEEGKPIGYYYGFKTDGIFQNQAEVDNYFQEGARPGDLKFVDLNNDQVINNLDRTDIGDPFPTLTYGFRLGADYKGFDLQVLGQGTYGNEIMNIAKIDMKSGVGWYNAPKDLMAEAWSPTNPSNTQFKISAANQNNLQISDWLVEDGSYLRIKSIQLGYTLPSTLFKNARIDRLRLWAGAYNLFTFTKYTGLDPEIGSGSPLNMGVDQGYYPIAKSYMFGVNFSF